MLGNKKEKVGTGATEMVIAICGDIIHFNLIVFI